MAAEGGGLRPRGPGLGLWDSTRVWRPGEVALAQRGVCVSVSAWEGGGKCGELELVNHSQVQTSCGGGTQHPTPAQELEIGAEQLVNEGAIL